MNKSNHLILVLEKLKEVRKDIDRMRRDTESLYSLAKLAAKKNDATAAVKYLNQLKSIAAEADRVARELRDTTSALNAEQDNKFIIRKIRLRAGEFESFAATIRVKIEAWNKALLSGY